MPTSYRPDTAPPSINDVSPGDSILWKPTLGESWDGRGRGCCGLLEISETFVLSGTSRNAPAALWLACSAFFDPQPNPALMGEVFGVVGGVSVATAAPPLHALLFTREGDRGA